MPENINNFYNKNLKKFARSNRNNSTLSEKLLWNNLLKSRGLKGYQFLRQRPIDIFIVDFFSKDLNLIIELDGITHEQKKNEDKFRQKKLEGFGYTVLRFDDEDVIRNYDKVRMDLEKWVEAYEVEHPEVLELKKRIKKLSSP